MATKKKTAAPKLKRPPRQVWIVMHPAKGPVSQPRLTKASAEASLETWRNQSANPAAWDDAFVAGPYVLAERVRAR